MPQYPAVIDLGALGGTGLQINGEAAGDSSGRSVASAGDVNGDGFADLIVAAPRANPDGTCPCGTYAGVSYVVFGHATGFIGTLNLSALNGRNGFQLSGETTYDRSGSSVAGAGDVNGDGFADLIVGAPWADPNGQASGASYVVFGRASGFTATLNLSTLDGTNGFQISGEAAYGQSGRSVASAGDVNGDGFDDLIIGAPYADANGTDSGASYVVFGRASGFGATLNLAALDGSTGFQITGGVAGDRSGRSVAGAGDVNGDGFADLVVGAYAADPNGYNAGATYVVFGRASGFGATLSLSALGGTNGFQINGEAERDYSGYSVAGAGDVNGDGFADLIIGARFADPNGTSSGASYVVFGRVSGFPDALNLSALDGINGFQISGEAVGDFSGISVAGAGDVNGDGFADLIVGAFAADPNGYASGASYVVFGRAAGFAPDLGVSTLDGTNGFQINGATVYDGSGRLVAGAGDTNGDGLADLIVGASGADPNGAFSGASYVVFGRKPDASVNRVGTVADQTLVGSDFTDTLSGGRGEDQLYGNAGSDGLLGGAGNDVLRGGLGADVLKGNQGADVFVFASAAESGVRAGARDKLLKFQSGEDKVDLTALGITDFEAQAEFTANGGKTVLRLDLDGDGAFDDFSLLFTGDAPVAGDFIV